MNIYQAALDYLTAQEVVGKWSELSQLLTERFAQQPIHWHLPLVICEAVGGQSEQAIPAVATIACLHTSIVLIDDMLDDDPKGMHLRWGDGATANISQALTSLASYTAGHAGRNPRKECELYSHISHAGVMTALGQAWDVHGIYDEDSYWRIAHAKSAPFFGLSFYLGAQMGGADEETCRKIEQLGQLYGELIQVHDDLGDSMVVPASPDWRQNHATLPILFAQTVEHPELEHFQRLRKAISDQDALSEAQGILIRCGAISYTIDHLLRRYQYAQDLLKSITLPHPEYIDRLFLTLIQPVKELLRLTGEQDADAALQILIRESALQAV